MLWHCFPFLQILRNICQIRLFCRTIMIFYEDVKWITIFWNFCATFYAILVRILNFWRIGVGALGGGQICCTIDRLPCPKQSCQGAHISRRHHETFAKTYCERRQPGRVVKLASCRTANEGVVNLTRGSNQLCVSEFEVDTLKNTEWLVSKRCSRSELTMSCPDDATQQIKLHVPSPPLSSRSPLRPSA